MNMKIHPMAGISRAKRKRGRPRIEGILREPNGRRSRAKNPAEAIDKLAIIMRAKHTGLSEKEAEDPRSSTYIGRLFMLGTASGGITEDQYNAAIRYIEIDNNYKKALQSPGAYYANSIGKGDPKQFEEFCRRAKKQYQEVNAAIQEAQFDNREDNLYQALRYIVIENLEIPNLLGAARLVLNALSRHFLLEKKGQKILNDY